MGDSKPNGSLQCQQYKYLLASCFSVFCKWVSSPSLPHGVRWKQLGQPSHLHSWEEARWRNLSFRSHTQMSRWLFHCLLPHLNVKALRLVFFVVHEPAWQDLTSWPHSVLLVPRLSRCHGNRDVWFPQAQMIFKYRHREGGGPLSWIGKLQCHIFP